MSAGTVGLGERPERSERSPIRFVVFGLVVALLASVLGVRLFMLQVANNVHFSALAETNRAVDQAITSTRGVIYDRSGVPLVSNVPSYTIEVRPADLPEDRRWTSGTSRRPPQPGSRRHQRRDRREPGIAFRSRSSCFRRGRERREFHRGVPARPPWRGGCRRVAGANTEWPADVPGPRYTGPVTRRFGRSALQGYLPDDSRQDGRRGRVRDPAARHVRRGASREGRVRPELQCSRP